MAGLAKAPRLALVAPPNQKPNQRHGRRTAVHFLPSYAKVAAVWSRPRVERYHGVVGQVTAWVVDAAQAGLRLFTQGYAARILTIGATLLGVAGVVHLAHMVLPCAAHQCGHGGHAALRGLGNSLEVLGWMAEPGRPDATFGGLCVFSNVFFVLLTPVFWFRRRFLEFVLVFMVGVASTVYHSLQIHPACGPLHLWTRRACVSDITLALTLGALLAARYPRTRRRALLPLAGALVCFIVPSLLPAGQVAEVGYSLLHSAWHGFAALAAYAVIGNPTLPSPSKGRTMLSTAMARFTARRRQGSHITKVLLNA